MPKNAPYKVEGDYLTESQRQKEIDQIAYNQLSHAVDLPKSPKVVIDGHRVRIKEIPIDPHEISKMAKEWEPPTPYITRYLKRDAVQLAEPIHDALTFIVRVYQLMGTDDITIQDVQKVVSCEDPQTLLAYKGRFQGESYSVLSEKYGIPVRELQQGYSDFCRRCDKASRRLPDEKRVMSKSYDRLMFEEIVLQVLRPVFFGGRHGKQKCVA